MKGLITFILIFSSIFSIQLTGYSKNSEETLFQSVLLEGGLFTKKDLARTLGRIKTPGADYYLTVLLTNQDTYWNRLAGVEGLKETENTNCLDQLVKSMINDHMIRSEIADLVRSRPRVFYPYLEKAYSTPQKSESDLLIDLMASSKLPEAEIKLKDIVSIDNSKDRTRAFQSLIKYFNKSNHDYFRGFLQDKLLKEDVLLFILDRGNTDDLPIFQDIIIKNEGPKWVFVSCMAIDKWGTSSLKEKVFQTVLNNKDETLVSAVLKIFMNVQSDALMDRLRALVKNGGYQETRVLSAERLTNYHSKEVIPSLITILDEVYINESMGVDLVAAAFTLGISAVFESISKTLTKNAGKDQFYGRLEGISRELSSRTGVKIGVDYKAWFDWAILNGYTVNGVNIVQYLFSGYTDIREKALNASIQLLGYKNPRDFFKEQPSALNLSDTEYRFYLARLLIEKGYLLNEKY